MKTLVIGTGGREHALALALSRDPDGHRGARRARQPGHRRPCATLHDVDPMDGAAVAELAQ